MKTSCTPEFFCFNPDLYYILCNTDWGSAVLGEVITASLHKDYVRFFVIQVRLDVVFYMPGSTPRPFLYPSITKFKAIVEFTVINTLGNAGGGDE